MTGAVVPESLQMSRTETLANPFSANILEATSSILPAVACCSSDCKAFEIPLFAYITVGSYGNFIAFIRDSKAGSSLSQSNLGSTLHQTSQLERSSNAFRSHEVTFSLSLSPL